MTFKFWSSYVDFLSARIAGVGHHVWFYTASQANTLPTALTTQHPDSNSSKTVYLMYVCVCVCMYRCMCVQECVPDA